MKRYAAVLICAALTGCSGTAPVKRDPAYSGIRPMSVMPPPANDGSLFRDGRDVALFEDQRARRVGDILVVKLMERTNASKKSDASTSKESSVELSAPTIFGRPVTLKGTPILSGSAEATTSFDGKGDASQSNSLQGYVTVTVSEVLPNGNLVVRGEKIITLNQGSEFVRLSGVVRPVDIATDNSVLSTQVADAEITYGGEGALADANTMGWGQRFLQSKWWPF